MTRGQWILAGLLVAQVALLAIVTLGGSGNGESEPHALLPRLESFTPSRIEIREPDREPVVLERGGDGWTLSDPKGFPADGSKIDTLLSKLEGIQVQRPVVTGSRYHEALEVASDKYQRRLSIWDDANDDPRVTLFVGTSPNFDLSHVRVDGSDRVYEARGVGTFDLRTDPVSWVNRSVFDVPQDRLQTVVIDNPHGRIELERGDRGWTLRAPSLPAGKRLDATKVESYVSSLASMFFSKPGPPADDPTLGLSKPVATLELQYTTEPADDAGADEGGEGEETADSDESAEEVVTVTLRVGGEVGDGERYAVPPGSKYAVVLAKPETDRIADKKLADLLAGDD